MFEKYRAPGAAPRSGLAGRAPRLIDDPAFQRAIRSPKNDMTRSTPARAGFITLGLLRLLFPIVLLWMGGQGIYTAMTNRQPLTMPFAEYAQSRPDTKWVELTGAQLDVSEATWFGLTGSFSEVYVPLHVPGAGSDAKVVALLLTRDSAVLDLVREMKAISDDKAALAFILKNRERLAPVRDVRGLLKFGIDSEDKKRRKIAKLNDNLTADFVVIEEGKQPEILTSLGLLGASLVAAWLCWFCRFGKSADAAVPPPLPQ